jgi:hypothetical protein
MRACGNYICLRQERSNGHGSSFASKQSTTKQLAAAGCCSCNMAYSKVHMQVGWWIWRLCACMQVGCVILDHQTTEPTGAGLPSATCSCLVSCLLPFCTAVAAARLQVALQVLCSNQAIYFTGDVCWTLLQVHKCVMMMVGYTMGHQASGLMRPPAVVLRWDSVIGCYTGYRPFGEPTKGSLGSNGTSQPWGSMVTSPLCIPQEAQGTLVQLVRYVVHLATST